MLLADADPTIREWTIENIDYLDADLTPAGAEIARLMLDPDRSIASQATRLARDVRWGAYLDDVIAVAPGLPAGTRTEFLGDVSPDVGERHDAKMRPLLKHADPTLREFAVDFYGRHSHLRPAALAELLGDPEEGVRAAAISALGREAPRAALLEASSSKSRALRAAAIAALVSARAPEAAKLVESELRAGNGAALAWAGQLADPALREAVEACAESNPTMALSAASYFVAIGEAAKAVERLRSLLRDGPVELARQAVYTFGSLAGIDAADEFILMAGSLDEQRRLAGVEGLRNLNTSKSREHMLKLAGDPSNQVRMYAMAAIYGLEGSAAFTALMDMAKDATASSYVFSFMQSRVYPTDDPRLRDALASAERMLLGAGVRAHINLDTDEARARVAERAKTLSVDEVVTLSSWFDPNQVPGLCDRATELAKDATGPLQTTLDTFLARRGDAAATKRLAEAALEQDEFDRPIGLSRLAAADRARYVAAALSWAKSRARWDRESTLSDLAVEGVDEALDALIDLARTDGTPFESDAASYLLEHDPARLLPRIRPLLASPLAGERQFAANLLWSLGQPEDVPRLKALLKDPVAKVRREAVVALQSLEARDTAADIAPLLADADEFVRLSAAETLAEFGKGPLDALKALAGDPSSQVRRAALVARAALGDTTCADDLVRALRLSPLDYVPQPVYRLGKSRLPALLEFFRERRTSHADPRATEALAAAGDKDAIAWLRADPTATSAAILLECGLLDSPADALPTLAWSSQAAANRLLLAFNRTVDPKRHESLTAKWTPARWVGPTAADHARALCDLLGLPVKAHASLRDRDAGSLITAGGAYGCHLGGAPVLEGDGVTLYSYAAARAAWERRLKK
jgi:HEAT repeat protein